MDMLHLVPAALLSTLGFWLMWPAIADPITRRRQAARMRDMGSTDTLADMLFESWPDQDDVRSDEAFHRG